ncbi:MAG: bifunctional phosphoglucose/phosphomannose isomerase [Nitrososphaeria archaeon]|nr:bifunctional phosphoglucose/phosphomannose isomerase [Nitrososphaeria archaeon]NIN53581.1 bifunctional phosphoglucose/phosphomannose isomerase [Nitrososphaeria archaeon]NIQ34102.1 bifunctional phosphoglucose/phosphomannose isomerase [Nitrososphaeria archaeon]
MRKEVDEMLTPEKISKIDKSCIHLKYLKWPEYFFEALRADVNFPEVTEVDRIILAGMGGSGIVGDVIRDWLAPSRGLPIHVVKDYHLPGFVDKETFVVAISYSGNTEETLGIINEAISRRCALAVISSGGLAEELSLKLNIPHTKIMSGLPPRAAFPLLFVCTALVMQKSELIEAGEDLYESGETLKQLGNLLTPEMETEKNPSKRVAIWLHGALPIIYGSCLNGSVVLRFKGSLNENAKTHAVADVLPELCHNDLVAWDLDLELPRKAVFVRFVGEPPEVRERFDAVKEQIEGTSSEVYEVWPPGESHLSRILSAIYLLDFASIYLAVLRGVDPTPTKSIDKMKRRLGVKLRYLETYTDLPLKPPSR